MLALNRCELSNYSPQEYLSHSPFEHANHSPINILATSWCYVSLVPRPWTEHLARASWSIAVLHTPLGTQSDSIMVTWGDGHGLSMSVMGDERVDGDFYGGGGCSWKSLLLGVRGCCFFVDCPIGSVGYGKLLSWHYSHLG